jgi:hypothetical protein
MELIRTTQTLMEMEYSTATKYIKRVSNANK